MNARRLLPGLCLPVLFLVASSPALGLANRVFVSARSGNNANSCDNVNTPCQTLAGSLAQTTDDLGTGWRVEFFSKRSASSQRRIP